MARVVLSLAFTLALFPRWPRLDAQPSAGLLALLVAAEAALGVTIGVAVGFIIEAFLMAAQVVTVEGSRIAFLIGGRL
jgi:flagellar biosynthesis protein FliR